MGLDYVGSESRTPVDVAGLDGPVKDLDTVTLVWSRTAVG